MTWWKYLIAVMGGFQYGYTIAVIAGALLFLTPLYQLDDFWQGFLASSILLGAFVGSACAGRLAEQYGRKRGQMLIAATFFIGFCITAFSSSFLMLTAGRIVQGLASGAIMVIGPMYLAEVSSPAHRGAWVSCYQLAVTLGILCAYFVSFLFSAEGAWRWMFGVGIIPALVYGVGFYFLPDSRPQEASSCKIPWKTLLAPSHKPSLILAVLINIFQQFVGINAVIYFAPTIFEACGMASNSMATFAAVLVGAINFISTFIAIFLVDTKGRRPLLLISTGGMILSLITLSFACLSHTASLWLSIASLMFYIASFAMGMGPICQLITSELFTNSVRCKGMTVALFVSCICNLLVVFTFMNLSALLSQGGVFLLYAFFGLLALIFIWKWIPETKGSTLL